jgi:hypothetical protein
MLRKSEPGKGEAEVRTGEARVTNKRQAAAGALLALTLGLGAATPAAAVETIIFVRHGEKPSAGLGQLSCRGLNRALALPRVIAASFARPDAIFAPNPADRKLDHGIPYDYIRPLATIEPTAVALGMPVDTRFGVNGLNGLVKSLTRKDYRDATVLVAWEHHQIVTLARRLLARHGGDEASVPAWAQDDFDSIYVVTIDKSGPGAKSSIKVSHEGLNGLADACPQGAPARAD